MEQLQFRRPEPAGEQAASRRCAACKSPIYTTYFQIVGKDICENCATRIRGAQQAPPAHSLLKGAIYGSGAAIAGCVLYATVAIVAKLELALLAILIGYMVGRAVRHGSNGLGGRPQQILAVVLTYFAITFSYVAVFIYDAGQKRAASGQHAAATSGAAIGETAPKPVKKMSFGRALASLVLIAAIAPFLALAGNVASGLLSLVIIFFGLQRAWKMTGRTQAEIFGPYSTEAA